MKENEHAFCTAKGILTCAVTCLGASLTYGYNLIILNLPGENIKCFLRQTILEENCFTRNGTASAAVDYKEALLYALLNASHTLFATLSALSCGWLADTVGRRNGLILTEIPAILGAVMSAFTVKLKQPALIYIGRCLIGINAGFSVGFATMYLTEIAPKSRRGIYGLCHSISVAFGIILAVVLTLSDTLNSTELWPVACGISGVASFIALIVLPFCPESPRHVYITRKNKEKAQKIIKELFPIECAKDFIEELEEEMKLLKRTKFKFTQLFIEENNRRNIIIVCIMPIIQQFAATSVIVNYSSTFLKTAGLNLAHSQYFILGLMIFQCCCVSLAGCSVERLGRRTLVFFSLLFVSTCLGSLSITINLAKIFDAPTSKILIYLTLVLVVMYVFAFNSGLACIPQLLVSELFCQEARGTAYSFSQAVTNFTKLIVLISFPTLNERIGGYTFLIYFFISTIGCVYIYFKVPETTNRTFIQNSLGTIIEPLESLSWEL